jgi:hypothetical protein
MNSVSDPVYQSRFERLKSKVEYPEAWKPEEGDTLVGEAIGWETVSVSRDDGTERACEVLTVRELARDGEGNERSVWTWQTVLRNELIGDAVAGNTGAYKVQPGDFVSIHYRGKKPRRDGNREYAAYRVAIEKADDKPTFDKQGAENDDDIPF